MVHPDGGRILNYDAEFLCLEPGLALEAQLLDWWRVSIGGHYFFAPGMTVPGLDNYFSGQLTLKFGPYR